MNSPRLIQHKILVVVVHIHTHPINPNHINLRVHAHPLLHHHGTIDLNPTRVNHDLSIPSRSHPSLRQHLLQPHPIGVAFRVGRNIPRRHMLPPRRFRVRKKLLF